MSSPWWEAKAVRPPQAMPASSRVRPLGKWRRLLQMSMRSKELGGFRIQVSRYAQLPGACRYLRWLGAGAGYLLEEESRWRWMYEMGWRCRLPGIGWRCDTKKEGCFGVVKSLCVFVTTAGGGWQADVDAWRPVFGGDVRWELSLHWKLPSCCLLSWGHQPNLINANNT